MLQQFSWTQFLLSSTALSLLWYAAVLLTAYRTEFYSFLKRTDPSIGLTASVPIPENETTGDEETQLMGVSRLPEGMEKVSMAAISFGPSGKLPPSLDRLHDDQIGLVPDVIREIREIFEVLAQQDGSKADFFRLIGIVSHSYGRIGSNPNIGKINLFIREHAPFALTAAELENLWD